MSLQQKFLAEISEETIRLEHLATHMTQNHIRQRDTGSKENVMVSNTFDMNAFKSKLHNFDAEGSMDSSCVRFFDDIWTRVNSNRLTTTKLQQSPEQKHMTGFQQNMKYPIGQEQAAPAALQVEELLRLRVQIPESRKIFRKIKYDEQTFEKHLEVPKAEIESSNNGVNKHPKYLVYGGVTVEDVYGVSDLDIDLNGTEYFYNFVENYVIKRSNKKYEKYHPSTPNEMPSSPTDASDAYIKIARVYHPNTKSPIKIYHYKMHLEAVKNKFQELTEGLLKNEQYCDAIKVIKSLFAVNCKDLDCTDYLNNNYVFLLTDAYLHEHCFYQACKTLFTWLKNDPRYKPIVRPNFAMEDKTETTLDKEQLKAVIQMFIKASQLLNPPNPDPYVQIALFKLYQIDQNYEKSINYCEHISNMEMDDRQSAYKWMCLGNSLALGNRSKEAIDIFKKIKFDEKLGIKAITKIGLIYLYNRQYRSACIFLFAAIDRQINQGYQDFLNPSLENSWSRIRLCFEVMGRDDLREAVDHRDRLKIVKHIYG